MLYVNPLESQMSTRLKGMDDSPENRSAALQELEHMFVFKLLQEMRKTVEVGGSQDKSQQEKLFDEMFDDAVSAEIAQSGQFGLATQIEQQMKAALPVQSGAALDARA